MIVLSPQLHAVEAHPAAKVNSASGPMPRSIQEILEHADELADRLEHYEPSPADERPVEEYQLERAAVARPSRPGRRDLHLGAVGH